MGSGSSSLALQNASAADLQSVVADMTPKEVNKVKMALDLVKAPKKCRKRVKCGGKTFAPYGMRTDIAEDPPGTKDFTPYKAGDDLPAKVDLRKHMSEIEDQSQCNSCCANAVAGAYEYINRRYCEEKGDEPGDISRLFIYYVGRKKDMETEGQLWGGKSKKAAPKDEGMSLQAAIAAMQMTGACLAPSWPYDLEKLNEKPSDECFKEAKQYRVLESRRVPVDIDAMRQCLAEGNPIVFGLMLTDQFFRPGSGGIVRTPSKTDTRAAEHGLHAMLIVGYNDRQQVFIVRNSWGPSWGDQGYCLVPYDYAGNPEFNLCQQFTITGLSKVDFTPGPDDGEDFDVTDDTPTDIVIEEDEEPEEPDQDDDFDFEENFKGDTLVKQYFLEHGGKLSQSAFHLAISLYSKGEGGKHFDWLAADDWIDDESQHEAGKEYWTPEDFNECVTKFYKKSEAEKFPNLAFLWS